MLAQKLILSYSSRILTQVVQIVASIIVARFAGPAVLGTVTFGLAYVRIFAPISDLGITTGYIKKMSEGAEPSVCIGTLVKIKFILTGLFFCAVLIFFLIQKLSLNVKFESPDHEIVILLQLVTMTVGLLYSIPKATFAARVEIAKSDIPEFFMNIIQQILRILVVFLGFGAIMLTGANLLSTIAIAPIFLYLFKNEKIGQYDKNLAKDYFYIAAPVMLTTICSGIISSIDVLLLQFFTNSEQTGYYTAGFRVGGFVLMIANSVGGIFFPIFSRLSAERNFDGINLLVTKFERFTYIYIMPIVIITSLFSNEVVELLLGPEYSSSALIMVLINITMFLKVVNTANGSILAGYGQFKKTLYLEILYLIVFVALIILLTAPNFLNLSGVGVATAMLSTQVVSTLAYRYLTTKVVPEISNKISIQFLIIGIVIGVLFYLFKSLFYNPDLTFYILAVPSFFLSYFVLLYLLRLLERQDISLMKQIFDYRSMKHYVKSEVIKDNKEE